MPNLVEVARKDAALPVREAPPGSNRHPVIDKALRLTGNSVGLAWCAAIVCYWFYRATGHRVEFSTASSQAVMRWAKRKGRYFTDPQRLLQCKGALFGWTNHPDTAHGHVGVVASRFTTGAGRVAAIGTLEGNTNGAGSRSGDGVYELRRALLEDGTSKVQNGSGALVGTPRRLWFVDLTGVPGGEYWS